MRTVDCIERPNESLILLLTSSRMAEAGSFDPSIARGIVQGVTANCCGGDLELLEKTVTEDLDELKLLDLIRCVIVEVKAKSNTLELRSIGRSSLPSFSTFHISPSLPLKPLERSTELEKNDRAAIVGATDDILADRTGVAELLRSISAQAEVSDPLGEDSVADLVLIIDRISDPQPIEKN